MRSLRVLTGFTVMTALTAAADIAGIAGASATPWTAECSGNPDALGTSRVLVLEPGGPTRLGVMQYPQTLPLADKEVVLTFDDGPLPRYSNPVLDILAAQCVKATYFLVGEMARAYPAAVRRVYAEGHTIGTHTEHHASRMQKLPIEKVHREIDDGIADVGAALGDPGQVAPFFRIPGLARSDAIEEELAVRSLIVFSSDTVADDWHRRIKPADIVRRAMSRLEARGKGILLLHDIHPATVAALPELLKQLKEAGFHVVHVVPGIAPEQTEIAAAPAADDSAVDRPETAVPPPPDERPVDPDATDRTEIAAAPAMDDNAVDWPESAVPPPEERIELPAPDENEFATDYRPWRAVVLADGSDSAVHLALAAVPQWSDPPPIAPAAGEPQLPAPAIPDYFGFGGGETVTSIEEK